MTVYDNLIDLFAAHAVSEIEGHNGRILKTRFGVATVEDLAKIEGYKDNFDLVKVCKLELENILARNATSAARQVTECLESLYLDKDKGLADRAQEDRPSRTETFRDLIKRSVYATAWTAQECATFDAKYEVLMEWRHYFLSYTNRDAFVTNNTFRKLIEFVYGAPTPQWQTANFIAPTVAKILKQNNVSGFFDHNDLKSGDEIEDEIRVFCRRCWAFVQIMEPETLATPPGGKLNWCFEEYNEFVNAVSHLQALAGHTPSKRYHFVITLEHIHKLKPVMPNPNYSAWFAHAEKLHYKSLQNKEYEEVRDAVREIASRIKELRKSVIADLLL